MLRHAIIPCFALALGACSAPESPADSSRPDLSDLLDGGSAPKPDGAPSRPDTGPFGNDAGSMGGHDAGAPVAPTPKVYAMKNVTAVLQRNPSPVGNDEKPLRTEALLRLEVEVLGEDFQWREQLCDMMTTPVRFGGIIPVTAETSYPQAFIRHFPVFERRGQLASGGDFSAGPFATIVGAELDNPLVDPLPQAAGDPGEVDGDQDGEPGVTVQVAGTLSGQVYVAQRNIITMRGRQREEGRIEGLWHSEGEQVVFGASSGLLETPVESRRDPEDAASYFILQEIEADWGCSEILAEAEELF